MENVDEYAAIAHTLVDSAIEHAMQLIKCAECDRSDLPKAFRPDGAPRAVDVPKHTITSKEDVQDSSEEYIDDITEITIEEFTEEKGEETILEFVNKWDKDDCWLYYTALISTDDLEYDTRYRYKVCFSIPTRCQPIPRATASVYFTVEVSKIKPPETPVNVFYVFETNRLVHRPGESRFQETWLKDIIISKMSLRQHIDF